MKKQAIERAPTVLERVVQVLRVEIRGAKRAGEKLDCIASLSEQLKVSTNTVRAALTILQNEGLVELRHGSGTYVRQAPTSGKHVALIAEIDLLYPATSFFFKEMFRQLRAFLLSAGHEVRIYSGTSIPGSEEPYSILAGRHLVADLDRVSAVAAFLMMPDEPWIEPVRARGIPIVSNVPGLGASVTSDRTDMIRQAVQALAQSGRRRIGLINWGSVRPLSVPVQDHSLVDLFVRMVRDAGLHTSPGWQFSVSMPGIASAGWEAFRDIWGAEQEKPDGLVVTDDLLLPGVFDGLSDCGVGSPDPLLLATHFTEGNPVPVPVPFIKLSYSPEEHARAMADLVLGALNGNDNGNRQIAVAHRCIMELDAPKPVGLPI